MGFFRGKPKPPSPSTESDREGSEELGVKETSKGKRWSLFGLQKIPEDENAAGGAKEAGDTPSDGSKESGGDEDSSKGEGGESDEEGDEETQETSQKKPCETFPDSENQFHEVIHKQNWDLLEILLKEYDYKMYIKAKEPKKPPRKLRVAKYLPSRPAWMKEKETPNSPLYGLDALGRAPLHLCCVSSAPEKLLGRLLFVARDVASVPDETGSLPIHLAVTHDRSVDVMDKLVRGYYQGSWEPDGSGLTPLAWAVEMILRRQQENKDKEPPTKSYWAPPETALETAWQTHQAKQWEVASFFLENRLARRKKLIPREYRQITQALGLAAPPKAISMFLDGGKEALKKEEIAGPALFLCISRQYPLEILDQLTEMCPLDFPKTHRDSTDRGVVAAHYRIGCLPHHDADNKRDSFRIIMQQKANAIHEKVKDEPPVPPGYLDWWDKLKFLLNLWGSHVFDDDSIEDFDEDDLLLHNALSNSDAPPSLVRLLAALYPDSTDLEHPKSKALPIHLACRLWRFREYPPRRAEKEIRMDSVVLQLMEGDYTRTRKRYRDRLPLHHAIAAGKNWLFIKPLVVHDRKSLQVRDPTSKLYPFQLAASTKHNFELEGLTRRLFTQAQWDKKKEFEKDHDMNKVLHFYDLEVLSVTYNLLRQAPETIDHEKLVAAEAAKRAARPQRMIVAETLEVTEEVTSTTNMKLIRAKFGLGNVGGHFVSWTYESTRRGWKTHRSHFGVLKEAIMDGLVSIPMDKWWRKLKFWIWEDCPWEKPGIPRRDDFLLHGALCNPDTSPWIIDLLLELFPRSASLPLPGSGGCYPLHIACATERYVPLHFEFPNKRTSLEMTAKAFPDATLIKWKTRLPLHLAILHAKDWDEIRFLAQDEPVALAVPDPIEGFFPFQLVALNRAYNAKQRQRFEHMAMKEVGKGEWKSLSAHEKVMHLSKVLEQHEAQTIGCTWELLRRNPVLISVPVFDAEDPASQSMHQSSSGDMFFSASKDPGWIASIEANLSGASLDYLEDVYEQDTSRAKKEIVGTTETSGSLDGSISDPFLDRSFQLAPPSGEAQIGANVQNESAALNRSQEIKPIPRTDDNMLMDVDGGKNGRVEKMLGYDFEEVDPTFGENMEYEEMQYSPKQAALSTRLELGPFDNEELCYPRRKDILLVRKSSAHVVWRNEVLPPGVLRNSSKRNYWTKVLQQMGEEVDLGDIHSVRHSEEQRFIASAVVHGTTVCIDEDKSYVWVLCGEDAASAVENYDIEAAMIVTSSLLDNETGVWLDAFRPEDTDNTLSEKNNSHRVLDWVLGMSQHGVCQPNRMRYMITRRMLRNSFAHGTTNTTAAIAEIVVAESTRRLWFYVARLKLEVRFKRRRRAVTRYRVPMLPRYERNRFRVAEDMKRVKFVKKLKKKQRHAQRRAKRQSNTVSNEGEPTQSDRVLSPPPSHLMKLHQPKIPHSDDDSIGEPDLFDAPSGPPPAKPLLAAALKAREQTAMSQDAKRKKWSDPISGTHLVDMNQPKSVDDDDSLGSGEVFNPPKGPPPAKPLLAAARKAMEQKEAIDRQKNGNPLRGDHLHSINQPKMEHDSDGDSLDSSMLFNNPAGPRPAKPLLAAALKAKKQAEGRSGIHLLNLNQPTADDTDEDSLGSTDLFDAPRGPVPEKPLLAAALKAKHQAEAAKATRRTSKRLSALHLKNMNQPSRVHEDDHDSLGAADIFDPPRGEPPSKPLLAAALKAKEERDKQQAAKKPSGATSLDHLFNMNQPNTVHTDDNVSLGQNDIFDAPKGPIPDKPLLAAALKAREQREQLERARQTRIAGKSPVGPALSHLLDMNQPKTVHDDDNASLAHHDIFDPPKGPPPRKPLLAAALKAKESRKYSQGGRDGSSRTSHSNRPTPAHLLNANQPGPSDDDDASIGVNDVFDPPKPPPPAKPLLAAALKAKADRENSMLLSPSARRKSSILRKNKIGSPEHLVHKPLNDSIDLFVGSPTPKRKAVPMTAKLVRLNSVDKLKLYDDDDSDSIPHIVEAVSPPPRRRKTQRPSVVESPERKGKKEPEKKPSKKPVPPPPASPPSPRKRKSIMQMLGRKQQQDS